MSIPDLTPLLDVIAFQVAEMKKLREVCDRILYKDFEPTITPIRGGFEVISKGVTCFRKLQVTQAKGIKAWVSENPHSFSDEQQDILPSFGGTEDELATVLKRNDIDFPQKLRIVSHVWETLITQVNRQEHLSWFEWTLAMGEMFASCDNKFVIAFAKKLKSLIRSRNEIGAIAPDISLQMTKKVEEWADKIKQAPPLYFTDAIVNYDSQQHRITFIGFDAVVSEYYYWIQSSDRRSKIRVLEHEITGSCSQVKNSAQPKEQQLSLF